MYIFIKFTYKSGSDDLFEHLSLIVLVLIGERKVYKPEKAILYLEVKEGMNGTVQTNNIGIKAKIYVSDGEVFYNKVAEEVVNNIQDFDNILDKWKYADLIELFSSDDQYLCSYQSEDDYEECAKFFVK